MHLYEQTENNTSGHGLGVGVVGKEILKPPSHCTLRKALNILIYWDCGLLLLKTRRNVTSAAHLWWFCWCKLLHATTELFLHPSFSGALTSAKAVQKRLNNLGRGKWGNRFFWSLYKWNKQTSKPKITEQTWTAMYLCQRKNSVIKFIKFNHPIKFIKFPILFLFKCFLSLSTSSISTGHNPYKTR